MKEKILAEETTCTILMESHKMRVCRRPPVFLSETCNHNEVTSKDTFHV